MLYGWIISLYLTQALQGQFSSPELCHFFTLYTNKGIKGCLLSLLSLKCASNEHWGSIRSTQDFLFPPSDLGCRGTTQGLPELGALFSISHLRHVCAKKQTTPGSRQNTFMTTRSYLQERPLEAIGPIQLTRTLPLFHILH